MYTTSNHLRNHVDPPLAQKMIEMFLRYANTKNDAKTQIGKMQPLASENLSEERIEVSFRTKETLTIILCCIIQENQVKDPVGGGCPSLFHQCVTEIHFESKHKTIVNKMQKRFEEYFDKTNKEIPERISSCIFFNVRKGGKDNEVTALSHTSFFNLEKFSLLHSISITKKSEILNP